MKKFQLLIYLLLIFGSPAEALFAQGGVTSGYFNGDWFELGTDNYKFQDAFVIEMWVNILTTSGMDILISCFEDNLGDRTGYKIYWYNGSIYFMVGDDDADLISCGAGLTGNTGWHHIAAELYRSANELNLYLYIDGNLLAYNYDNPCSSPAPNYTAGGANTELWIGNSEDQYQPLNGYIDEVRIWSSILGSTNIRDWMHKPLTSSHPSIQYLAGYYKMDNTWPEGWLDDSVDDISGTGGSEIDLSNNGVTCSATRSIIGNFPTGYDVDAEALWRATSSWSDESDGLSLNGSLGNSNSEFYAFASNTGSGTTSSDCPSGVEVRADQIWYIDSFSNDAISLQFDCSDFAADIDQTGYVAGDYVLLFRSTTSGNFSSVTTGSSKSGDLIYFSCTPSDGYYTIGRSIVPPILSTTAISSITETSAASGGNVSSDGGAAVIVRGVCWSTSTSPTTDDNYTTDGDGTGEFISSLTGLTVNTTYYVRAYATNSEGTGYGEQESFTSSNIFYMAKSDGNWSSTATWKTSASESANPGDYTTEATTTPNINNCSAIIINSNVTLDAVVTVSDITVNSGTNLTLNAALTVNSTLTLNNDLNLNGQTLTFGDNAELVESAGNTLTNSTGNATITMSLNNPSSQNVVGMGAEITSSANLGSTTISRGHSALTGNDNHSIYRWYSIAPTNNSDLNATLVFHYDDSELNGITESNLVLFRSTDGGETWSNMGGTVNTSENTITLSGIGSFSTWTAGDSENPLPVMLEAFTATIVEHVAMLEWTTILETGLAGFELYRRGDVSEEWQLIASYMDNPDLCAQGGMLTGNEYSFCDETTEPVKNYSYLLVGIEVSGQRMFETQAELSTDVAYNEEVIPTKYELYPAYPNPFNPTTTIKFALPENQRVRIRIFDVTGRQVAELVNKSMNAGMHRVEWDAEKASSGIYFIRMETEKFQAIERCLLVK